MPSYGTDQVLRFDVRTGAFLDIAASGGGLAGPYEAVVGPDGNLYVSSERTNQVLRYDGRTGAFLGVFVPAGTLTNPAGLAFGSDGNLYVANRFQSRVDRFDGTSGAYLGEFASGGGLSQPIYIRFGPDRNLYVSDTINNRVLRYNGASGAFLGVFASGGGLNEPRGLAFGPDGNLYVSSLASRSVLRFNGTTGAFIDTFVAPFYGGLVAPESAVFGPDGNLYVASDDINNVVDSVLRYNGTTGAFIDEFIRSGTAGLNPPVDLNFAQRNFGNVISGNTGSGVLITGNGTSNNTVAGNYIGLDANGNTLIATPVSWWKAENNASDAIDGNTGTLQGGMGFAAGEVGQAFSFDGVDDAVRIPNAANLNFTNSLSIEAWVNPTDYLDPDSRRIVSKLATVGPSFSGYNFDIVNSTQKLRIQLYNSAGTVNTLTSNSTIPAGTFTHVAATWNPIFGILRLFVNGVLDSQLITSITLSSNTSPLMIGRQQDGIGRIIQGEDRRDRHLQPSSHTP